MKRFFVFIYCLLGLSVGLMAYDYLDFPIPGFSDDGVVHPGRYDGTSIDTQYVTVGLDPAMPDDALVSCRNAVRMWNLRVETLDDNFYMAPWIPVGSHDFQSIILHELGHVQGLNHVSDPGGMYKPVMVPGLPSRYLRMALHPDDVDGIENALLGINNTPYKFKFLFHEKHDLNFAGSGQGVDCLIRWEPSNDPVIAPSLALTFTISGDLFAIDHLNIYETEIWVSPNNTTWYYSIMEEYGDNDAHNSYCPLDVSRDGWVSPRDALLVISAINATGSNGRQVDSDDEDEAIDVNNDGWVTAQDSLIVINYLNTLSQLANLAAQDNLTTSEEDELEQAGLNL